MREYRMDIYQDFYMYPLTLSVCRQSQLRLTIIINQNESVSKQNSFNQQSWFAPNGETELLLQNKGYYQMILAFVSRSFGIGLQLNKEELIKVNK